MALIAIGVVVLLALAIWGVAAMTGGDDDQATPGGPSGPDTSPSQQTQTTGSPGPAQPAGSAAIQLTASLGPDSRRVAVQGSGFGANEEIVLSVDGTEARRVQSDPSGAFNAVVNVSFSKSTYVVRADGATSRKSASGTVTF